MTTPTPSPVRNRSHENMKEMEKPLITTANEQGCSESSKSIVSPLSGLAALFSGFSFGVAIDRARLNVPFAIIKQLEFQNFTMMRMFLAASATSTVAITLLHLFGIYERCPKSKTKLGFNLMGGFGGNVLGGLLLGIGMALSGACPGTVFSQLGAYPDERTGLIVAGGLVGVITFAYLEKQVKTIQSEFLCKEADPRVGKTALLHMLSLGSASMMGAVIFGLNQIFPWQSEMTKITGQDVSAVDPIKIWDPLFAGIVVGSLQIPSILASGGPLGMSSGWVVPSYYISGLVDSNVDENAPYLQKYVTQVAGNWQIISAVGVVAGSFLSANILSSPGLSADAMAYQTPSVNDFIGGFLMLLGARLGGGCTSGHGLSGLALCSSSSFVTVAFMFAGGMATRAIMILL